MAIGTDDFIDKFGTLDSLDGTASSSAVTDTSFSAGTSDLDAWTNDDDAPEADIVLVGTFGSAPNEGAPVHLYGRRIDYTGTNDEDAPSANYRASYLGSFSVAASASAQRVPLGVQLPNLESSQIYHFYIENQTGQTLNAGWTLEVIPKAIGPHA